MKHLYLAIIFLISFGAKSQNYFIDWVKHLPTWTTASQGNSVIVDKQGNFYVLNNIQGSGMDMDPSLQVFNVTTKKFTDALLSKYTPDGKRIWSQLIIDSLNCQLGLSLVNDKYVFVTGSVTGWINPEYYNNGGDTIQNPGRQSVLMTYDVDSGHFVDILYHAPDFSVSIREDNDKYWVAGRYYDTVDIDPTSGVLNIYPDTNEDFSNFFVAQLDSNFNVLNHTTFITRNSLYFTHFNIGDSTINLGFQINRRSTTPDIEVFGNDTLTLNGSHAAIIKLHKNLTLKNHYLFNNSCQITGYNFTNDEFYVSGENLYFIKGSLDTVFPSTVNKFRLRVNDSVKTIDDGGDRLDIIGKKQNKYLYLTEGFDIQLRDSTTDTVEYQYTNFSDSYTFANTPRKGVGYMNGYLYFIGGVTNMVNLGTTNYPLLLRSTTGAPRHDFFFGLFSDSCKPIADSTIYPSEKITCGVLVLKEEVDVKGNGLRYHWVNTRTNDTLVDVEWFDSQNFIAQFIRGANTSYLSYQWDVEYGAINGEYIVDIVDGCGNTYQTDTIIVRAYGIPSVYNLSAGLVSKNIGDTLSLIAQPDPDFDTLKYYWVKDNFFMFNFGHLSGTSTTNLLIDSLVTNNSGQYWCVSYHPLCPNYYYESGVTYLTVADDTSGNWDDWGTASINNNHQDFIGISHATLFNTELVINNNQSNSLQGKFFNLNGEEVKSFNLNGRTTLNTANLANGMYLLTIKSKDVIYAKKVIKTN